MFQVIVDEGNGKRQEYISSDEVCRIGKHRDNNVVLSHWRIAKFHAEVRRESNGLHIRDLGTSMGTWVNEERIVDAGPLNSFDDIAIGGFKLQVKDLGGYKNSGSEQENALVSAAPAIVAVSAPLVKTVPVPVAAELPDIPRMDPESFHWRKRIHEKLLETIDLRRRDISRMSDEELRHETESVIRMLVNQAKDLPPQIDRELLVRDVLNEAVGLGPLEQLIADETITEVMVNRCNEVYIERAGRLVRSGLEFTSDQVVLGVIERIVAPLGRRIDESSPMVDARLKDGSRVNAIIPPLALKGPCLTIRKFAKRRYDGDDMMRFGSLSHDMLEFLKLCVEQRRSLVVSGGTGTGKTTLLNVLSNFIPRRERVVTIEDAAELQLIHENLVSLEARPANLEGRGQVAIRDLVKNSLRMRPDRIVVGECRGGEALDMLQAMNTGHDGSLTTVHANNPRDAISRLEVMVLMAGMDLPVSAIREQIASAVNLIVQQTRFPDGSRKITQITELSGMESGKIQMQDIFVFRQQGLDAEGNVRGYYTGCGVNPEFYEDLAKIGMSLDLSIFTQREPEATSVAQLSTPRSSLMHD